MPEITYLLSFGQAHSHYIDIKLNLTGFEPGSLELKMPVWTPGSYLVREYAKNLVYIENLDRTGKWRPVTKTNKNTFKLITGDGTDQIRYRIYAAELTVRTSYVDQFHAYVNGAGVFLYVDGYQHLVHSVLVKPNPGWKDWAISLPVTLQETGDSNFPADVDTEVSPSQADYSSADSFSDTFSDIPAEGINLLPESDPGKLGASAILHYQATNFSALVDAPLSLGNFNNFSFTALGIPHRMIFYNCPAVYQASIEDELIRIVETEAQIFGVHPVGHYLFQVYGHGTGRGGLEHSNSCSLLIAPDKAGNFDHNEYLLLLAHEYFHLWNGKRLCPEELYVFDYDRENYTRLLWVVEGFTSYYESQILLRAGLISTEIYLVLLEKSITQYLNLPGRHVQSLADSSFDAWVKFYLPNENSANTTVSYYQKGSLVAMILDLKIIGQTHGKFSLDSVMKILYQEIYLQQHRGYTNDDLKAVLAKFIPDGIDLFFEQVIEGLQEIDFNDILGTAGLTLQAEFSDLSTAYLGISVHKELHTILQVRAGSPANYAGLSAGDELISIDKEFFKSLPELLGSKLPGQVIMVEFKRANALHRISILLTSSPQTVFTIQKSAAINSMQHHVYHEWLNAR